MLEGIRRRPQLDLLDRGVVVLVLGGVNVSRAVGDKLYRNV